MRSAVVVLLTVLLMASAVTAAIGATREETLSQGITALHEKDAARQTEGISLLESVIATAPTSAEACTACYQLGCHFRSDREKSLAYFKQGYAIPGKDQMNAGISLSHTLVAMGRKTEAAAVFEEVGTRFPAQTSYACYRAGMCWLGESRGKVQSAALRNKAKALFTQAKTAGNLEAELQLLGMRWEDCDNGHAKWDTLMPDLETFARDAKAPPYARARAFLMIAEHDWDVGLCDGVLVNTQEVLDPAYTGCRAEQAWAMHVRAMALDDLGRTDEAIKLYDDLRARYTDKDNFGGNNVRAVALWCKARMLSKLGKSDEAAATRDALRQEYPGMEEAFTGGSK